MAQLVKQFASGIYNLILGLFTTSKHLGRHAITVQYPKERWEMPERSRGMVVLLTDHETGKLNCTACLLCMKACPSGAIDIEIKKDEKGKRHLVEFKVDYHICCLCGLCEESCNFAAVKLANKYEFPEFDKTNLVWDSKKLAEMGFDVPYVKPVRKKPAAKKPIAKKPAADAKKPDEKPAGEAKPSEAKPEAEVKPATEVKNPEEKPAAEAGTIEEKSAEEAKAPDSRPAEDKTEGPAGPDQSDTDSKEDKPS
jgi:NADH-quinone oxidoreductase subunit I